MTAYVAFPSPIELRQDSEQLVANINARSRASQADLMMRVMTRFTDEVLKVFFTDTVTLMNMGPFMAKLVHGAVNSIRKTSISVSGTIIRKLDNKQLQPLAEHICTVMLTHTTAQHEQVPYVGFAVSDQTYQRLTKVIADMRAGNATDHATAFTASLLEITDLAVDAYLRTPIEILNLGIILRKLAEGGMSMIQGAVHMVIRKLAPDMESDQLLALAAHLEQLIIHDPKLGPTQKIAA
jgi:hypothetical protein